MSRLLGHFLHRLSYKSKQLLAVTVEDNARPHNSNITEQVRLQLGIKRFIYPPRSPDLDPIKRVWLAIKEKLRRREVRCANVNQLWEAVQNAWDNYEQHKNVGYI